MPKNTQAVPKKQAVSTGATGQQAVPSSAPSGGNGMVGLDQALERSQQQTQPTPTEKPTVQQQVNPFQQSTQTQQTTTTQGTGDGISKALETVQATQIDKGAMETAAHTDTQPTQTLDAQQKTKTPRGGKPMEAPLGDGQEDVLYGRADRHDQPVTKRPEGTDVLALMEYLKGLKEKKESQDDYLGGDGGDGTGATPTEEKPTIDTEETLEDPYSKTIEDYQTEVKTYIDDLKAMTEADLAAYAEKTGMTIDEAKAKIDGIIADLEASMPEGKADRVGRVDTAEEESLLDQLRAAQEEQAKTQIDYAVKTGVDELTRAEEDAQSQFQTMRDQIAANERQALDNQALYAEARGDKGGIGQAQYGSIQNNAATNQLTVNRQQTQLATDTARQIADLRAKGEFEKADKLLSISQEYLSKLMQLKQWADEANISIDEFNIGVQQWEQEYQAKLQQTLADLQIGATQWGTGLDLDREGALLDAQLDLARMDTDLNISLADKLASMQLDATARTEEKAADAAKQMIQLGLQPTDEQLKAIGWTKDQYDAYQDALEKAQQAIQTGTGTGGRTAFDQLSADVQDLIIDGADTGAIQDIIEHYWQGDAITAEEKRLVEQQLQKAIGRGKSPAE